MIQPTFSIPAGKVFIVAEIGINHNGDMEVARDAIHAAADAGADSVKFQNYYTDDFVIDKTLRLSNFQGKSVSESQQDLFSRCALFRNCNI